MKVIYKTAPRALRGKSLEITWGIHDFPVGKILVAMSGDNLCWLGIGPTAQARLKKDFPAASLLRDDKQTAGVARKIAGIWPKDLGDIDVPVLLYGTDFQLKVWKELLKIKSGKTLTYQDVAKRAGNPAASRAAGSAIGKNPVSILVPCHRVVNKTGGRVNYGWGADTKIALLKGEGVKLA